MSKNKTDSTSNRNKLEWLVRVVDRSHYACEYRQDNTPRTTVKCAGCCHSSEGLERAIQNVIDFVYESGAKDE